MGFYELEFDVMSRKGNKHQAADALSQLLIDRKDETDLTGTLPVLEIGPTDKAKEAEENDEKQLTVNDVLNTTALGLVAVSMIATTLVPFGQRNAVGFLAENSEDQLCCKLASTVQTPACHYHYNRKEFLIAIAPIDALVQKFAHNCKRHPFYTCVNTCDQPNTLQTAECTTQCDSRYIALTGPTRYTKR